MDMHNTEGATAEELAQAHLADLRVQAKHGVNFVTYWYDYERHVANCLVEAPNPESVSDAHEEAHGNLPNRIVPTTKENVLSFLGRIDEPLDGAVHDSSLRAIVFTDIVGSTEFFDSHGDAKAMEMLRVHNTIVREAVARHAGNEVKHTGDGFMLSFASPSAAVRCALEVLGGLKSDAELNPERSITVRVGINAGEPVTEDGELFGAAVTLASRICESADSGSVLVSDVVRSLTLGKGFSYEDCGRRELKGFSEPVQVYSVT